MSLGLLGSLLGFGGAAFGVDRGFNAADRITDYAEDIYSWDNAGNPSGVLNTLASRLENLTMMFGLMIRHTMLMSFSTAI